MSEVKDYDKETISDITTAEYKDLVKDKYKVEFLRKYLESTDYPINEIIKMIVEL